MPTASTDFHVAATMPRFMSNESVTAPAWQK